jgi:5-deoxy-glucuronate isomerase
VKYTINALSDVELAYNGSPVTRDTAKPTLIKPEDTRHIALGKDNWTRTSEIILDETFDSEHLYIGEGMIPSGNWSGYPSHRHDVNNPPAELDMEETYFYLFDPPQGFGFQSVYKPDGSLNEAYRVQNYDTVAIAEGYHPLVGAPGYQMYYLWTMAGENGRGLISSMDPAHAWVKNS